jgi:hypothetical protein
MYGKNIIGLGGFVRTKKELKDLYKDINLIYKHTHKDYRSNSEGIPKIMYLDDDGQTVLGPIQKLPKKIFNEMLKQAKRKEKTKGLGGIKDISIDKTYKRLLQDYVIIGFFKTKDLAEKAAKKERNRGYLTKGDKRYIKIEKIKGAYVVLVKSVYTPETKKLLGNIFK